MAFQKDEQPATSNISNKAIGGGKKTVVLGATANPERYAYLAAHKLTQNHHPIVPVGIKNGTVKGLDILDLKAKPIIDEVDTITVYMNPRNQKEWEDYMLSLKPKRIIFNPGAENPTFASRAQQLGIKPVNACTLVMLSVGNY